MTIETKFNLKDEVWFMKSNKPIKVTISAIETFNVGTNQDHIMYNAKDFNNPVTWLDHTNLHECTLYSTKEELLASL